MPHNEDSETIQIREPNASDWGEIAGSLCLPVEATTVLRQLVDQIVANIQHHAELSEAMRRGRNRRQQLAHIRRLSRLFTQLEGVLDDRDLNTDRIIRQLLASDLGELLSRRGISRLAGVSISSSVSHRILTSRAATRRAGSYEAIEDEIEHRRRAAAEEIAPTLVLKLVRGLNAHLARYLQIQRTNKGGAPGLLYRNYVIDELIPFYQEACGKRADADAPGQIRTTLRARCHGYRARWNRCREGCGAPSRCHKAWEEPPPQPRLTPDRFRVRPLGSDRLSMAACSGTTTNDPSRLPDPSVLSLPMTHRSRRLRLRRLRRLKVQLPIH